MRTPSPLEITLLWLFAGLCAYIAFGYAARTGNPPWGALSGLTTAGSILANHYVPPPTPPVRHSVRRVVATLVVILAGTFVLFLLTRPYLDAHPRVEWAVVILLFGGYAAWSAVLVVLRLRRAKKLPLSDAAPAGGH